MDISQKELSNSLGISITETSWQTVTSLESSDLWALVDTINWPEIQSILAEQVPPHACLYTTTNPDTLRIAPWLIRVEPDSVMQSLLEARDPNTHAVVFFHSKQGIRQLRDHFRRYTMLWTPANPDMPVYFWFYDPRVLMDMMSALDEHKLAQFFNGIDAFYIAKSYQTRLPSHIDISRPGLDKPNYIYEVCLAIQLNQADSTLDQTQVSQGFKVNSAEYQRFTDLFNQRHALNLAADLYQSYQSHFPFAYYETAAQLTCQHAPNYQIVSKNERLLLADCFLWLGQDFPAQSPAADVLLSEQHPQRFHHLMAWLEEEKQRITQSS